MDLSANPRVCDVRSMMETRMVPEARSLRPPVSKPGNPKPPVSDISLGPISPHFPSSQQSSHGVKEIRVAPIVSTARGFHIHGFGSTLGEGSSSPLGTPREV